VTSNPAYQKLLEPGRIGPVITRNRVIKTGAGVMMWHEDDVVMRDEVLAFYEAMARGGTGLIIVESPTVDYPAGCRWRDRYRLDDDKYIPGMAQIAEVIHKHGCPTFMQMNHDGTWQVGLPFVPDPPYSGPPYAASDVVVPCETDFHNEVPHPLSIPEIEGIVEKFAQCALRAKKAGFDGVDVNASSSHLLHNFLSPFWNRRTDEYGGSAENRSRFVCQVVSEIKRLCGRDFPVTVCINGLEVGQICGIDDKRCITNETAKEHARFIEKAGADGIMVRSHWIGYHEAAYLCDALFYPDAPIPLKDFPKEYYTKGKGAGANMLIAARGGQARCRPGREDPRRGDGRLHRDDQASSRRSRLCQQDQGGSPRGHSPMHRLRQLSGQPALPYQRPHGSPGQHDREGRE